MTPEQNTTLIKIEQKLTDLCENNEKDHSNINKHLINLDDKLFITNNKFDSRVSKGIFMWVIGGVFVIIFSLLTIITTSIEKDVILINNKLERHIESDISSNESRQKIIARSK